MSDAGEEPAGGWFDPSAGDDVFHVATVDGTTYVADPGMVLSTDSDLVVGLAAELSCLVVGAGAETVSGTFWVTAADNDRVQRVYLDIAATLTEPFSVGVPLPSESTVPWDDVDGAGILARLIDLGVPTEVLVTGPPEAARRIVWESVELPEPGPLAARIEDHCARFRRPDADDWTARITVATGTAPAAEAPDASQPKVSRWLGSFKRRR